MLPWGGPERRTPFRGPGNRRHLLRLCSTHPIKNAEKFEYIAVQKWTSTAQTYELNLKLFSCIVAASGITLWKVVVNS